jgi:antitoxin (DNA-binding transcriptional repressor) of toxin-antitoxin stability system
MQEIVSMHAAKSTLSSLVKRAAAGEPILIGAYGRATVKLVAVDAAERPRKRFGALKGVLQLPPDLEAPLPADVVTLFEGGDE